MHSKSLTVLLTQHGTMAHIHPLVHIFVRRLCMVRRIIAKLPHVQQLIQDIYERYKSAQFVGTHHDFVCLSELQPIPPHGEAGRQEWKISGQPQGPI
eukprot:8128642-Karenia_brevis.AAC.1